MHGPLRQGPFLIGLLLVTASTLALEVLDTRLLSVVTWYSLAFFVIAMGLCGLTAGAVHVYLAAEAFTAERLARSLSRAALLFGLAVPLSYGLLLIVPLRAEPVATTAFLFLFFSAALALPFYPAGIVVAAAITRSPFPIGRVYAVDLAGAALGAPLVPLVLEVVDGGTAILGCGVGACAAAVAFARAGADRVTRRNAWLGLGALGAVTLANASSDRGLVPLWTKERPEVYAHVEQDLWNSHSRVVVYKEADVPAMFWGLGSRCVAPVVRQRTLVIDGHAATPLYHTGGDLERLRFLECDVTNLANLVRPGGAAAIIGVGGSRDIQAALLAGRSPVVGIELNGRMLEVLEGPLGVPTGVPGHPDVRLVHDDARSWLSRTDQRFRLIQASLIDTWAATGAGAHALGENGLYTLEAWQAFLEHLTPDGVFTVSRWATIETPRMIALASAALLGVGAEQPREHVALVSAGLLTTLLVTRDPMTPDDEAAIRRVAEERGFTVVALPSTGSTAEGINRALAAGSVRELDAMGLQELLDFRPPTDDRPFFFNVLRLRSLWNPLPAVAAGTLEGNLLATRTLGLAFLASVVLAALAIAGPLLARARPRRRAGSHLAAGLLYFGLIGVGFLLAEIALLQRLSLVLGHPIYSLIVVLSSLVAAAGVGSFVSDRLPLDRRPAVFLYPALIALLLASAALLWPRLTAAVAAAGLAERIAFSVAVTSVLGAAMGLAFPAGMRLARRTLDEETPWLWGMNGIGSVVASSTAILIALEAGLTVLMLAAAACYAALLGPVWWLSRRARALSS
jgi:predicted membrane-bound spermidine synthase